MSTPPSSATSLQRKTRAQILTRLYQIINKTIVVGGSCDAAKDGQHQEGEGKQEKRQINDPRRVAAAVSLLSKQLEAVGEDLGPEGLLGGDRGAALLERAILDGEWEAASALVVSHGIDPNRKRKRNIANNNNINHANNNNNTSSASSSATTTTNNTATATSDEDHDNTNNNAASVHVVEENLNALQLAVLQKGCDDFVCLLVNGKGEDEEEGGGEKKETEEKDIRKSNATNDTADERKNNGNAEADDDDDSYEDVEEDEEEETTTTTAISSDRSPSSVKLQISKSKKSASKKHHRRHAFVTAEAVNAVDSLGRTPLHVALENCCWRAAWALAHMPKLNPFMLTNARETILYSAVKAAAVAAAKGNQATGGMKETDSDKLTEKTGEDGKNKNAIVTNTTTTDSTAPPPPPPLTLIRHLAKLVTPILINAVSKAGRNALQLALLSQQWDAAHLLLESFNAHIGVGVCGPNAIIFLSETLSNKKGMPAALESLLTQRFVLRPHLAQQRMLSAAAGGGGGGGVGGGLNNNNGGNGLAPSPPSSYDHNGSPSMLLKRAIKKKQLSTADSILQVYGVSAAIDCGGWGGSDRQLPQPPFNAIYYALQKRIDSEFICRIITQHGVPLDEKDICGRSALDLAIHDLDFEGILSILGLAQCLGTIPDLEGFKARALLKIIDFDLRGFDEDQEELADNVAGLVGMLIKAFNIQVNYRDPNSKGRGTALHCAIRNKRWKLATQLLTKHGADPTMTEPLCENNCLQQAIWWDAPLELIRQMLTIMTSSSSSTTSSSSSAASSTKTTTMAGKNVINAQNSRGETALHIAFIKENKRYRNGYNKLPDENAQPSKKKDLCRLLIEDHKADPFIMDENGSNAMHMAVTHKSMGFIRYLLGLHPSLLDTVRGRGETGGGGGEKEATRAEGGGGVGGAEWKNKNNTAFGVILLKLTDLDEEYSDGDEEEHLRAGLAPEIKVRQTRNGAKPAKSALSLFLDIRRCAYCWDMLQFLVLECGANTNVPILTHGVRALAKDEETIIYSDEDEEEGDDADDDNDHNDKKDETKATPAANDKNKKKKEKKTSYHISVKRSAINHLLLVGRTIMRRRLRTQVVDGYAALCDALVPFLFERGGFKCTTMLDKKKGGEGGGCDDNNDNDDSKKSANGDDDPNRHLVDDRLLNDDCNTTAVLQSTLEYIRKAKAAAMKL